LGTGPFTRECWVFDMIRSPSSLGATPSSPGANEGYSFAAGTSMAAPAVAAVAALAINKNGPYSSNGAGVDALVNHLAATADHPAGGARVHGMGRVNAFKATQ
jgi:lantibiotic leader peptide-processing serine protease